MIDCGSQCWLCDLPIRYDNYRGCSHGCKYCFVQRGGKHSDLGDIQETGNFKQLINFINGNRSKQLAWCDWDIPLHWGGISDPFQPVEKKYRSTLKALKIFRETQYPFVVSTKGRLLADDEYLDILKDCNAVVQISMVCPEYDKMEPGAPSFYERVEMARKVAAMGLRVNARVQPYMTQVKDSVMNSLERFTDAGVYGVIVEGMKFQRKIKGLEKLGGDYVYPVRLLRRHFSELREKAHALGLAFYSGENRLREMGDSLTCCGIDGLDGFRGNDYNVNHMIRGEKPTPTTGMMVNGYAHCFAAVEQTTKAHKDYENKSFAEGMAFFYQTKRDYCKRIMGKGG